MWGVSGGLVGGDSGKYSGGACWIGFRMSIPYVSGTLDKIWARSVLDRVPDECTGQEAVCTAGMKERLGQGPDEAALLCLFVFSCMGGCAEASLLSGTPACPRCCVKRSCIGGRPEGVFFEDKSSLELVHPFCLVWLPF